MNNETTEKMNPESAPALVPGGSPQRPDEFLSKEELALRLKRTVRTIEVWQKRGILPYVKCENTVLFNWAEVVAHLQKNFRVCPQRTFGGPVRLPDYHMREEPTRTPKSSSCRIKRAKDSSQRS